MTPLEDVRDTLATLREERVRLDDTIGRFERIEAALARGVDEEEVDPDVKPDVQASNGSSRPRVPVVAPPPVRKPPTQRQRVATALKTGPKTCKEIAAASGLGVHQVRVVVCAEKECFRKEGPGIYGLTENGRKELLA